MRVLVVDDDKLVVESLKTILEADGEIEVAGTGFSADEAIRLYDSLKPDVLLMDIRMEGKTGIDAAKTIIEKDNTAKILFLTTFSDDEYIARAFLIGAKGYILKQNFESINSAIKAVFLGQRVFGDEIISRIPVLINSNGYKQERLKHKLTERELEIVVHVANGLSNKEIAEKMFLGEGTVRNYISTILEKLDLRDRTQLAIYYYKNL
ncbi:MAG TPA: response regulator transcription factor [Clostridiaceae bacterium]|nr:response regulator transcription factor [Clostridiaceae bacterium]